MADLEEIVNGITKNKALNKFKKNKFELADFETYFTGNPLMDIAIGGGILRGAVNVLYGQEATAKSTLALQIVKSIQRQWKENGTEGLIVYIDAEERLTKRRVVTIGVDEKNLSVYVFKAIEDITDFSVSLYKSIEAEKSKRKLKEFPVVVVWDSVGATTSKEALEDNQDRMATDSRALAKFFKKILPRTWDFTYILVQQYRTQDIGKMFAKENVAGGFALKHHSSMSIMLSTKNSEYLKNRKVGKEVDARMLKSSVLPAEDRKFSYIMTYSYGVDAIHSALNYLYTNLGNDFMKISMGSKGKGFEYKVRDKETGEVIKELRMSILDFYIYAVENPESVETVWKPAIELLIENEYEGVDVTILEDVKKKVFDYYFSDFDKFKYRMVQSQYDIIKRTMNDKELKGLKDGNKLDDDSIENDINNESNEIKTKKRGNV